MDNISLRRCFDLARQGVGYTNPNPLVGSILVHNGVVIGEGFHQNYGKNHAEVNCINSVAAKNGHLIPDSSLYVSLEPCCFHGNTPACTDLIINNNIKKITIAAIDSTAKVNGQGIRILENQKIAVNIQPTQTAEWLVRFRTTFVTKKRPHIILKYAVSKDGFIGKKDKQVWLTNPISRRLVHKWRSESSAILVGTNTALTDNPKLDNRHFLGPSPLRIVLDKNHKIPNHYHLKDDQHPTWIICEKVAQQSNYTQTKFIELTFGHPLLHQLMDSLYHAKINSLLVEGGAQTLQSFIDANLWDEAYVLETQKILYDGITAPVLNAPAPHSSYKILNDKVQWYQNPKSTS